MVAAPATTTIQPDYDANMRVWVRDIEAGKKPDIRPPLGRWDDLAKDIEQGFVSDAEIMRKAIMLHRRSWPEFEKLMASEDEFQFLEVRDLSKLPKPEWLIYDIFPTKGVNFLYGRKGCGKTYVAISMACSVAMEASSNRAQTMLQEDALNWCGRTTRHGHVIYIAGEDIDEVAQRVQAWMKFHNVSDIPNLHFLPSPLRLNTDTPRFIEAVKRHYQDIDIALIVVDTLAVCSMGLEENSKKEFDGVLGALEKLWRDFNACVVAVHHAGKNGEMRGTSSMDGIAYSMIEVSEEDENIKLRSEKKRRGKKFESFYLDRQIIELPGLDEAGRQMNSCVVTLSDRKIESDAERLTGLQQRIIDVARALGGKRVARADIKREMNISEKQDRGFIKATGSLIKKGLMSEEKVGRNVFYSLQGIEGTNTT
jgi:hypothetical protein